jgi:hypothetical protein
VAGIAPDTLVADLRFTRRTLRDYKFVSERAA